MTSNQINTADVVLPAFYGFWRAVKEDIFTYYVLKGGRSSAKSTTIAQRIIMDVMKYPVNVIALRKVARTLEESCYEQLKEATQQLGVEGKFKLNKSPLKITYMPRGNEIIFRGADDPIKVKSIKKAKYPIAIAWFEELAEFKTYDDVDVIIKSILRAILPNGLRYRFYMSYNPPKRKGNWCNKKYNSNFLPDNTYVHHSTYKTNPYLSEQTIQEAKEDEKQKPMHYKHIWLGEAIGGGVVPFNNLVFRTIPNEEFKAFDNIREGLDWGYATDPLAWVQWHYDKKKRIIYAMKEFFGTKIGNRQAVEAIGPVSQSRIIADSSEPKSIEECRRLGLSRIIGAKKGPGSVETGEKWLDELEAIVIDPKRTPHIAKEFEDIDYQVDRFGEVIPRLEDKNNHTIDATRYAFEEDLIESTIPKNVRVVM